MEYLNAFISGYKNYALYLWSEITNPGWHNYFYWLIGVSAFFFVLELLKPWRSKQPTFRKDFWLDFFYMFFNFFLFSLIIYNAASDAVVLFFKDAILWISGFDIQASNPLRQLPLWAILLIGFVIRDFIQWWIHRLLHYSPALWEFHKVHHSVEQMGFAAHLRYHWMENVVYRAIEYTPLALLGIGLYDFFIIHIFALAIGHYNHSNLSAPGWLTGSVVGLLIGLIIATNGFEANLMTDAALLNQVGIVLLSALGGAILLGPWMKKLFNSPEMHIWHHAYDIPAERRFGINFGLSLAIWDYIFGTAYIPHNGRDIKLGFPGVETFPVTFSDQAKHGVIKKRV